MDLDYTQQQRAFRVEAREWLEANVPAQALQSMDTEQGFAAHREWETKLNEGGWAMVSWPVEYGGRGVDLIEWLIFEEEYYRAGAPGRVNQNGIFLLGPTLMEFGSDEQKARFLPPMAAGIDVWAQGWSEPNAGSDMAAIRTTAFRDGDHYVVNGQKTWCSRAVWADWIFCIFRTDPDSERHRGLSFMLVPLDAEGVQVRAIEQLDGETGFAEVFFDNVRVPVDQLLGEEGGGWKVAMSTAGFERGLMLRSPARYQATARKLVALLRDNPEAAQRDPTLGDRVIRGWMQAEAYALQTYRTASRIIGGGSIGAESSLNKIFWSEMDLAMHETAMALLGPRAELLPTARAAGDVGDWLDGFQFALAGPIYAGTNEIQRNIAAERLLGLPRG
ncbi:MAG TPA: acyl-CoA dehydrogenase [Deltaproteobacteria bacterium]|nr:acyl-CoA dehydrogenase family protein [Deltaproteobacteria bacterium]HIF63812.1 acyl-CoA dehydrogenase [Candidatus Binatota bacterium]HIL14092.1 acyl-CoA dehydrogenase [Deltaproteobacteria bacterium]